MNYDVTIGIPVYQSADYIGRALLSALGQSYASIEFLMVDDGGHDGSLERIRQIQQENDRGQDIRILTHERNLGVAASRNQIIDEARGEFLYFMDSDDEIAPGTIQLLMDAVRRHRAEIAFGSYEKRLPSGETTRYQYPPLQLLDEDALACFAYRKYGGFQASACNFLVKTAVLRDSNLRFIETDYWEDMAFTFDLVTLISRAVLLPDITYHYYCREGSLSHYQERATIEKVEILKNARTIDHLKKTSATLQHKVYYPRRCLQIAMTNFYMACHILKRRNDIVPRMSNREIRDMMAHPARLSTICSFRQARLPNLALYTLSRMPGWMCVGIVWCAGKARKLV